MGINGTRTLGTLLMGVGLLLVLSVGGYFAWNEVQAAQVRTELEQSSSAAAARSTRVAEELAGAIRTPRATPATTAGGSAQLALAARAALTATPRSILPQPARTATGAVSRTATATPSQPDPTAAPASPSAAATDTPSAAPSPTPAPVMPVRLVIPDLKIDSSVVEMGWEVVQTKSGPVSEWSIPKNAAGHHINSASIGETDNLVISGHNNIYGRVFMPISQAWTNDGKVKVDNYTDRSHVLDGREVYLFDAAGHRYNYVITDFYRVRDSGVSDKQREINGRFILPTGDERVTILTCWPPTNNTHRLVVIARPEK